jgi:S1-C subfamily serine protease
MILSAVRLGLSAVAICVFFAHPNAMAAPPVGAGFEPVVAELLPSVVTIETEVDGHSAAGFFGESFGGVARGSGSGFVVEAEGVILTNAHVVEGARRIEVELHDGRRFIARLLGSDETTDIAALQIQATGLRPVRFGDSDAAKPGRWVAALGADLGTLPALELALDAETNPRAQLSLRYALARLGEPKHVQFN